MHLKVCRVFSDSTDMISNAESRLTLVEVTDNKEDKLHLYRVFILPIMLCGSECWAINKADIQRIVAVDKWCLGRILEFTGTTLSEMPTLVALPTSHHFHLSLSPIISLSLGILRPIWILLKQETVSGIGISWAICKSAPRSTQITMPVPHRSFFTGRMPFLPPYRENADIKISQRSGSLSPLQWLSSIAVRKRISLYSPTSYLASKPPEWV